MSYDIDLIDPKTNKVIELDEVHHLTGGTYQLGGTKEASLNITYNYSNHYARVIGEDGIRTIYGMTGAKSIPILVNAIKQLGNDVDDNYWKSTEGNAKIALANLLVFATSRPDGIWKGD